MQIKKLCNELGLSSFRGKLTGEVNDIVQDSRQAGRGKIFLARRGFTTDGHEYIDDAYQRGSRVFVVEEYPAELKKDALYLQVEKSSQILGKIAAEIFNHPEEKLAIYGITGTNGKTTTTFIMQHLLKHLGVKCGLIGTIQVDTGQEILNTPRTTPEANQIFKLLDKMVDAGCEAVVMEVSSHALSLERVEGLKFAGAIFTNISRDHLDFHADFADYLGAKLSLLEYLAEGAAFYNIDDNRLRRSFREFSGDKYSFGIEGKADYQAQDINFNPERIAFSLQGRDFTSQLTGKFNIYNCLAAISPLLTAGYAGSELAEGLNTFSGVPGRFEQVKLKGDKNRDFQVFVDYAHTPAGMKNVLSSVAEFAPGKIISVFGCGGDRDKEKRPEMGKIGYEMSDLAIITSDNPRSEDPGDIIADILPGIKNLVDRAQKSAKSYQVIEDREEAIFKAVKKAEPGDIVIIFGKGHETYQEFADRTIDFDDREVARRALASLGG